MIIWSIGLIPVQEWIADARRSRDLKIGSATLSWFTAGVLKELVDGGAKLLVPFIDAAEIGNVAGQRPSKLLKSEYGISNRASGWWNADLQESAKVFERLQKTVDSKWEKLRKDAHDSILIADLKKYVVDVANPIRVVWCATEHKFENADPTTAEKTDALKHIEKLYVAVKRARPIMAHHGTPVGKCGQCGKREAAGPPTWDVWRTFHQDLDLDPFVKQGFRIDVGERLCPVCLIKRFTGYLTDEPFPSTSEIASRDWLFHVESLPDLVAPGEWRQHANTIPGDDPYPLLYERTVKRRLRTTEEDGGDRRSLTSVLDSIGNLSREVERLHPELPNHPSHYLAVLTFDGDDMGEKVQSHPDQVPAALASFSRSLKEGVKNHQAESFYLGGDEGLILCPIETSLALAEHIRKTFENAMLDVFSNTETQRLPTVSVGIAIFDRERPLAAAIQSARQGLEAAKDLEGKNGLAVNVKTASGNSFMSVDHWEAWKRVIAAIDLTKQGHLSSSWAYDIERLLETLPSDFLEREDARTALREEVRRITYRRLLRIDGGDDAEGRAAIERAKNDAWQKLEGSTWWADAPEGAGLDFISNPLHLIAFYVRQTEPADAIKAARNAARRAAGVNL